MKLNQSGEKLDSLEKHLKENKAIDTTGWNENRIKSLNRIIKAREIAQKSLNGNRTDTVSVLSE